MVNNIQNIIKKHNDMVATIRADLLAIAKQHPDLAEQVKSVLNTTLQNGSFLKLTALLLLLLNHLLNKPPHEAVYLDCRML